MFTANHLEITDRRRRRRVDRVVRRRRRHRRRRERRDECDVGRRDAGDAEVRRRIVDDDELLRGAERLQASVDVVVDVGKLEEIAGR